MPRWLAACWLALLAWAPPAVQAAAGPVAIPRLEARVTDLTGTLTPAQRGELETALAALERERGAQAAILLLPSTQPETIEQFGIRLAEAWKIGHKGADDGVIVIVAKDDRRMRIEVGYGLEGAIPDAVASRIIRERMTPRFKAGDFHGGLLAAVRALTDSIAGQPGDLAAPAQPPAGSGASDEEMMPWLLMLLAGAGILRLIFGLLGSLVAAAIGGWLGFMVFGSAVAALIAALVVFLLSFANLLPGRGGGWSGGGGFSSGGGYSGGGGGFGGGGSSGRW